jgi:hypothetical protein
MDIASNTRHSVGGDKGPLAINPPDSPKDDDEKTLRAQLVGEVNLMLKYALEEGLEIDSTITSHLSKGDLATDVSSAATQPLSSLIALHSALAKVVAPATPCSLNATEPAPGWFGFARHPPLIGAMVIAAVLCALGFVVSLSLKWFTWNYVIGAGLGSSFYALFTAHDYVKQRTFDPRYNSVYMIRFVLGVISGIILANLPIFGQNPTLKSLGPGVLALLGGFSAEAVNQVLQRLVEVLIAVVKGSGSDVAEAQLEQSKAKMSAQLTSAKQAMSQGLSEVLSDSTISSSVRERLGIIQGKLK